MKIEDSGLRPDTQNANEGTQRGLGLLDKSLRKLGAGRSILVDAKGNVIAGNKTLERAADIDLPVRVIETDGTELIAVKRTDLDLYSETDKRARQLAYADNKVAELDLAWKPEQIALDFEPLDLGEWGFEAEPEQKDAEPQIDRAAELNEKWKVVTGDLWQIGEHRLLCGDSTKREDVDRAMQGEKADMVLTDPPYGMNLDTDFSGMKNELKFAQAKGVKAGKKYDRVEGDNEDFKPELITTIFDYFSYCKEIFLFGADYYSELLVDKANGSWIVWDKRSNEDSKDEVTESRDKIFTSAFELCWSKYKHKRKIARILWAGIFGTEKENNHVRYHPTQKPVRLFNWFFENWGNQDDVVYDPYIGSGTTMVACENLHRKCRAIEISPNYCAVILERMNTAFPDLRIERISNTDG